MKIAAVVVTFNRKEYLVKNIEALLAQVNAPMDILIIDNASTDGTEETIRHYMDAGQILYENTGENLGGADVLMRPVMMRSGSWTMTLIRIRMHWRSSCRQTKT